MFSDAAAWAAFRTFVLAMLALDLSVFHREAHVVSVRESAAQSTFWVILGLAFGGLLWIAQGGETAGEYLAGYLIERSLSIDNVFVFIRIFSYFKTPAAYQHRVLFLGVLCVLVLRVVFILAGAALLEAFAWIVYVFVAFLVYTDLKMFRHQDLALDPSDNRVLRDLRRVIPLTTEYDEQRLFTRQNGSLIAIPLLAVLVMIETTDVIFAVTRDPFIVFTSNVFAILGLRALYFLLAGVAHRFVYLRPGWRRFCCLSA